MNEENKVELKEKQLEQVTGGDVESANIVGYDDTMLERGGKNYAKDTLGTVPPGSSPIVLFDEN